MNFFKVAHVTKFTKISSKEWLSLEKYIEIKACVKVSWLKMLLEIGPAGQTGLLRLQTAPREGASSLAEISARHIQPKDKEHSFLESRVKSTSICSHEDIKLQRSYKASS